MKRVLAVIALFTLCFPSYVSAHPGRTAADGCHYCRTNCDRWGVPWYERHCHGGGVSAPSVKTPATLVAPTVRPTARPTAVLTLKPTVKATVKPTHGPTPESAPTLTEAPQSTIEPTPSEEPIPTTPLPTRKPEPPLVLTALRNVILKLLFKI